MRSIDLADTSSLLHLVVDWKPVIPGVRKVAKLLCEAEGVRPRNLVSTVSGMLTLDSLTEQRKGQEELIEPFLDIVRNRMAEIAPEKTEAVCMLFRRKFVSGRNFDIDEALRQANDMAATATAAKTASVNEPIFAGAQSNNESTPTGIALTKYEDVVQSVSRTDDVLPKAIECRLRVGLCGGSNGFELRAFAIPSDAFELSAYVQNHRAPVDADLVVTFQLPDRVSYVPGYAFVVTRQDGKDCINEIREEDVLRLGQVLRIRFDPRSHNPEDSIYVHIICRIDRANQFPFGASDLSCRTLATIGNFEQVSNSAVVTVRRARHLERLGVLTLCGSNRWVTDNRWVHRTELIAVAGDQQRLRLIVTNQGTEPILDSSIEIKCSHRCTFSPRADKYLKGVWAEPVTCNTTENHLVLPLTRIDPGSQNAQLFILEAILIEASMVVTVTAKWLTTDEVLANDYIELRPMNFSDEADRR